ncbi:hypothetical protein [Paenibacillus koleovorans]|uniref:hypothetical protein n=1 Tax=Paenibacillus koleovorans TaxID=121608 RepID=UPI000FD96BED|nr:hypothetical protein [Paenibacillus koleovorans]
MRNELGYVRQQLSLVVTLVDGYTKLPPKRSLPQVYLEGTPVVPMRRDNAYYFMNLQRGPYKLHVQSDMYWNQVVEIDLNELSPIHPVVPIWLAPKPNYPEDPLAFIVRSSIREASGKGLEGVSVEAVVTSMEGVRARLGRDGRTGDETILLSGAVQAIADGETLAVRQEAASEWELAVLEARLGNTNEFTLHNPLQSAYPQGTKLHSYTHTMTDHHGDFALYISLSKAKKITAQLRFSIRERVFHKEVTLEQGKPLLQDAIVV